MFSPDTVISITSCRSEQYSLICLHCSPAICRVFLAPVEPVFSLSFRTDLTVSDNSCMFIALSARASLLVVFLCCLPWAPVILFSDFFVAWMGYSLLISFFLAYRVPLTFSFCHPVPNCSVNDVIKAIPLTRFKITVHFTTLLMYLVFPFIFGAPVALQ